MTRAGIRFAASAAVAFLVVGPAPAWPQFDQLLRGLGGASQGSGLSDVKIGEGLKEALKVGTEKTVSLTGKTDGYFTNQAIKILMPSSLRSVESGLRAIGFGSQVDELVLGMNRAAERAAPQAQAIFLDAIGELTIGDSRAILAGGDTAATDYFKGKTTDKLVVAFRPVVEQAMGQVGVARQYQDLVGRAQAIPFVRVESLDINRYVVDKSLDGLFHVLGEQEQQIRTNPTARATDLLKQVFAK